MTNGKDNVPRTTLPTKRVDLDEHAGNTLDVAIQVVNRYLDDLEDAGELISKDVLGEDHDAICSLRELGRRIEAIR